MQSCCNGIDNFVLDSRLYCRKGTAVTGNQGGGPAIVGGR